MNEHPKLIAVKEDAKLLLDADEKIKALNLGGMASNEVLDCQNTIIMAEVIQALRDALDGVCTQCKDIGRAIDTATAACSEADALLDTLTGN